MYNKLPALLLVIVTFFGVNRSLLAAPEEVEHTDSDLTRYGHELVIGGMSGILEVTANQPIFYFKNCVQQRRPIHWKNPSVWYRGYIVNAGSAAPITALQMGVNAILTSFLAEDGHTELSDEKRTFAGFLAGAVSAVACAPVEHTTIRQQFTGAGLYSTGTELWSQGSRAFFRGLIPTAAREGTFTAAYIAIAPLAQRQMLEFTDDELLASIGGSVTTGIGTTLVTQPWDMIKTTMQSAGSHLSVRETISRLYQEGGLVHFWSGSVPRGCRVVLAIGLMTEFQRRAKSTLGWK